MNTNQKMNRKEAIKKAGLLIGGVVLTPSILKVINECAIGTDGIWEPSFFNKRQAEIITALSDVLLPEDSTPSASQVGVPAFIETMVQDVYSEEQQKLFLQGLDNFDKDSYTNLKGDFCNKSNYEKNQYVNDLHRAAQFYKVNASENIPFILMFRELAILGYFTSEEGATQVLRYEEIPGRYSGCVPIDDIGRTWAT